MDKCCDAQVITILCNNNRSLVDKLRQTYLGVQGLPASSHKMPASSTLHQYGGLQRQEADQAQPSLDTDSGLGCFFFSLL
jgi:hypothetical protein